MNGWFWLIKDIEIKLFELKKNELHLRYKEYQLSKIFLDSQNIQETLLILIVIAINSHNDVARLFVPNKCRTTKCYLKTRTTYSVIKPTIFNGGWADLGTHHTNYESGGLADSE